MPGFSLTPFRTEARTPRPERRAPRRITEARIQTAAAARRGRGVLAGILFFSLILMSAQKREAGSGRTLLEKGVLTSLVPIARGASTLSRGFASAQGAVVDTLRARSENVELKRLVAQQKQEIFHLRAEAEVASRRAELLKGAANLPRVVGVASIVLLDTRGGFKHAVIAAGSRDGVSSGSPLAVPEGLVGRVLTAGPHLAKAQLLLDANSAVGARVARTGEEGVVRGDGTGQLLFDYLPALSGVQIGDRVETAGIDGIYPASVPIGNVRSVGRGKSLFLDVKVAPSAQFNRLSDVLVLASAPAIDGPKP